MSLRRAFPLVLLLIPALFPIGWLGQQLPPVDAGLSLFFGSVAAHAVAHTTIFFTVGMVVLLTFPALQRMPVRYTLLMLSLGVAQEAFQLLYKQRPLVFDDFRDLASDAVGFVVAFVVVKAGSREPGARSRELGAGARSQEPGAGAGSQGQEM